MPKCAFSNDKQISKAWHICSCYIYLPDKSELTRLFHPRTDTWKEPFRLEENGFITGLSSIGRATTSVLAMNSMVRVQIRVRAAALGVEET